MSAVKPKALIVEDQELFRNAVADELDFFGFETITAENGLEGLKCASSQEVDLILSDIRMPQKDGKWMLGELRKVKRDVPFVFMSGFADLSAEEAYQMGADGFLGKPLPPEKLIELLEKLSRPLNTRWSQAPAKSPGAHFAAQFSKESTSDSNIQIAFGRGGFRLCQDQKKLRVGDLISFNFGFDGGEISNFEGVGLIVWKADVAGAGILPSYGVELQYLKQEHVEPWIDFLKTKPMVPVIPSGAGLSNNDQNRFGRFCE